MYAKEQHKRILNLLANVIVWAVEVLAFAIVWYGAYDHPFYDRGNYAVVGVYALFMFLFTKSVNGYSISYLRLLDLIMSHALAIGGGAVVGYLITCMAWGEYVSAGPILAMAGAQFGIIFFWVWLVRHMTLYFFAPRRIIVIYGNYPPEAFLKKINTRQDKYEVCEVVSYKQGYEKILTEVLDFEGALLYDLPAEERNTIMKYCYEHSIRTYVVPKITDIIMKGSDALYLVDTPLFLSRNIGLHVEQRFVKRFMDIVLSLIALLIASPFMLLIALAIKLCDGGPVFYRQVRLTRGGKEFRIFKFRSMRLDAEKTGAQLASKHDDRVTPVGRVLRNLHLDELPQLFNVLAGDMSMVGPRPERPEIFAKYEKSIPEFDFRLKVKAGITGYAQVYGKYNTTPIDKLKLDLTYIQEFSYWLDLKLMLLTFRIVFRRETSEGVEDGQTTALLDDSETKGDNS